MPEGQGRVIEVLQILCLILKFLHVHNPTVSFESKRLITVKKYTTEKKH